MGTYQKIAILGRGFLGSVILEHLVNAGFTATVFTRNQASKQDVPAGVEVVEVDYASLDSLTNALKGHDVAISTVNAAGMAGQNLVIDACIQAGVKRYIPCDWSSMSSDPKAAELAAYVPMRQTQEYLEQKAALGQLTYTSFNNGVFFDMIFTTPILIDWDNHAVRVYDGGVHPFSTSRLATVGKAVAAALKNPDVTENKVLLIHDAVVTQAQILALAKKHTGLEIKWTETALDAKTELQNATKSVQERGVSWENTVAQLTAGLLGGEFKAAYKSVDNALLGLGYLTEEEIEAKVIERVQK